MKRVNHIVGEIAAAKVEQAAGIEQLNQAIGYMDPRLSLNSRRRCAQRAAVFSCVHFAPHRHARLAFSL